MYPFHHDQIYCYVHASPAGERGSVTVISGTDWSCRTSPRYCVRLCSGHTIGGGAHCRRVAHRGEWPSGGGQTWTGTENGLGSLTPTTNLQKGFQ